MSSPPSGLDADPTAYLALPRFNKSLDFTVDPELAGGDGHTATVTYALTDAPADVSWPLLVFFNGLGGHRLITAVVDGITREHKVQVLTIDKPGAGGSARGVDLPLALRTCWMHVALLAVLAAEQTTQFALLSHSNGFIYALYTLLHLPPTLTVTSWTVSAPYVPPSISGSLALSLAASLPASLPNALGSLMQAVPPVSRAVSWSGGLLSLPFSGKPTADTAEALDARERRKPPHERGYTHRAVSPLCQSRIVHRALAESRVAIGQEALFCLRADAWGLGEGEGGTGMGTETEEEMLRGALVRFAARYAAGGAASGGALSVRVVYGTKDGLVPAKGRAWLKAALLDAGVLGPAAWREVPGAGHDEVLFLEEVVGWILEGAVPAG